ncbi:MAG: tRNA (adenosine(37)-N6)-threonylcarbamoyltransferase complex dimerization subunit type 1 TsaB [Phycisphaerales bacterium]|nr:tRNA (adenosine(37)-N6)-threonylcarbamoyltransferase complex dimerization subunit type 1 TsaB [Phycisphaerales bacterium]
MPLTLAIETSNPSAGPGGCGVAIGDGQRLRGEEAVREATRHDDDLMPAIDRLTRRLGIGPRDIGRVAVSVGPGGYTAVRTAVATGKLIAEGAGARCIAVPTAMVAAVHAGRTPGAFVVCLASKGDSTHATVFTPAAATGPIGSMRPIGPIAAADVAALGVQRLIADGFLPATIAAAATTGGMTIEPLHLSGSACYEASLALPDIDPVELLPLYPREPDAVTQWRRRLNESRA